MNNQTKIILGVAALLVVLLVLFIRSNTPQWDKEYKLDEERPYDLSVFVNTVESNAEINTVLEGFNYFEDEIETLDSTDRGKTLFCIGNGVKFKAKDTLGLKKWVQNGNDLFLSLEVFPKRLFNMFDVGNDTIDFYGSTDYSYGKNHILSYNPISKSEFYNQEIQMDTSISMHIDSIRECETDPEFVTYDFDENYLLNNGMYSPKDDLYDYWNMDSLNKTYGDWQYFDSSFVNMTNSSTLGFGFDKPNFISINYGQGKIYLHTTPMAFTNYFLRNEKHLTYVEILLNKIRYKDVLVDNNNMISKWEAYNENNFTGSNTKTGATSSNELAYILSKRSWSKAWYTLLFAVALFLFFGSKRRQRIIPIVWPKENKSLKHLDRISDIYIYGGNHKTIAKYMVRFFDEDIYKLYRIKIDETENVEALLSEKSGVDKYLFDKLIKIRENLKNPTFINENILVNLNDLIIEFNKKRR